MDELAGDDRYEKQAEYERKKRGGKRRHGAWEGRRRGRGSGEAEHRRELSVWNRHERGHGGEKVKRDIDNKGRGNKPESNKIEKNTNKQKVKYSERRP